MKFHDHAKTTVVADCMQYKLVGNRKPRYLIKKETHFHTVNHLQPAICWEAGLLITSRGPVKEYQEIIEWNAKCRLYSKLLKEPWLPVRTWPMAKDEEANPAFQHELMIPTFVTVKMTFCLLKSTYVQVCTMIYWLFLTKNSNWS